MLNLRKKDHEELCNLAQNCFKSPVEIWAYGSRVNGDNHDASDLNLVARNEGLTLLERDDLVSFKNCIQHSNIPILVQVFDWKRLPNSFHSNILENYEVLFSNLKQVRV
jgi:hypothetical protein